MNEIKPAEKVIAVFEVGECRNGEAGDWFIDEQGVIHCRSINMPKLSAIAVCEHELVEILRCQQAGLTDEQVSAHDAMFLKEQKAGLHPEHAESGFDPRSPYKQPHADATFIERCFCAILGMGWDEHERNVENARE